MPGCRFRGRRRIRRTKESAARANLQMGTQHLHLDFMELRTAARRVEIAPSRLICDQVIAAQIVESVGQPLAEVVVVVKENAAGSARHLVETYLRAIKACLALPFRASDYLGPMPPSAMETPVAAGEK